MPPQPQVPMATAEIEETGARLRGALGLLYRRIRQTRVAGDLTLPESSALSRLEQHGPCSGAELAKLEQVSPQSIGATLQGLEAKGLLGRSSDPADGRRVILSLTASGQDAVRTKRAARTEQLTRALESLAPADRARLPELLAVLERLAEAL